MKIPAANAFPERQKEVQLVIRSAYRIGHSNETRIEDGRLAVPHRFCSSAFVLLVLLALSAVLAKSVPDGTTPGHGREGHSPQIKQHFPSLLIILLSAYAERPERILWLVPKTLEQGGGE